MAEPERYDLVVIGGGQSARWLLYSLAEELARGREILRQMRIAVIEKTQEFGTGLAWSRRFALAEHLASVAVPEQRVVYGDRQQQQFHATTRLLAEFGVTVTLYAGSEAVAMQEEARGNLFSVTIAAGGVIHARFVVLATGYWQADDPLVSLAGYHATPWPAAWLQRMVLGGHPAGVERRVLVLGTYLTGIDAVLSLAVAHGSFRTDRAGRLTFDAPPGLQLVLASRRGLLPGVWGGEPAPPDLRVFGDEALGALRIGPMHDGFLPLRVAMRLVGEELALAEPGNAAAAVLGSRVSLDHAVRGLWRAFGQPSTHSSVVRDICTVTASADLHGHWTTARRLARQTVLFGCLPSISEASHALCAEDQVVFDSWLKPLFFSAAMPMPLDSAMRIEAMFRAGCLEVMALGGCFTLEVRPDGRPGIVLRYRDRAGRPRHRGFTDVVNARGQCQAIEGNPSPLIRGLVRSGIVQPALRRFRARPDAAHAGRVAVAYHDVHRGIDGQAYLRGGGIYVNPKTCEVIPRGVADMHHTSRSPRAMFAMGPTLCGQFIDAQSIGQVQRDAGRIVTAITRRLAQ
jgi:hypothetical protein